MDQGGANPLRPQPAWIQASKAIVAYVNLEEDSENGKSAVGRSFAGEGRYVV
jgi:hypothetical protein